MLKDFFIGVGIGLVVIIVCFLIAPWMTVIFNPVADLCSDYLRWVREVTQ